MAADYRAQLVRGKRDLVGNGKILVRSDNAPESLQELCFAVHEDASKSMPNDWIYLFIAEALDAIAEHGDEFYEANTSEERYFVLASWLADCPDAAWHCDQEVGAESVGIYGQLEHGYRAQWENVAQLVYGILQTEEEDEQDAA